MYVSPPHFLLFSESRSLRKRRSPDSSEVAGQWRFVLESLDGQTTLEATDEEFDGDATRLELLAVVRGLEALDQPSRVTLLTPSRYVAHGLRFGLAEWRENGWQWERFGEMERVKNWDLWQRIDHALRFHHVECRVWHFDPAEQNPPAPHLPRCSNSAKEGDSTVCEDKTMCSGAPDSRGVASHCWKVIQDLLQRYWLGTRKTLAVQAA
jgi:ribonuclease HI